MRSEWLALCDAELGAWELFGRATHAEPPVFLALRGWVKEKLGTLSPTRAERRARELLRGPNADAWNARSGVIAPPADATEARDRAAQTYVTLSRGGAASARSIGAMFYAYDRLLDPNDADTIVPSELQGDEAFVVGVQERLADGIASALSLRGAPLFRLATGGPISARVFQRLETKVTDDLTKAVTRWEERSKTRIRRTPTEDWDDVATLRMLFRRLEITLGPHAAARYFSRYNSVYWKLGSELSEQEPRMRPLAHAVFIGPLRRRATRVRRRAQRPEPLPQRMDHERRYLSPMSQLS